MIRQSHWPRQSAFDHYRTYEHPHFSLTSSIDVANLRGFLKGNGISFTIGAAYVLASAANGVPELRQRIRGTQVVEYECVHPSITVLRPDESFSFCELPFCSDFRLFARRAGVAIEQARNAGIQCLEDLPGRDDYLFLTGIPWISFTAFQHPVPASANDAIPRIAWGKFYEQAGQLLLPLNIQVHHALVDGLHVGRFYQRVERLVANPGSWAAGRDPTDGEAGEG